MNLIAFPVLPTATIQTREEACPSRSHLHVTGIRLSAQGRSPKQTAMTGSTGSAVATASTPPEWLQISRRILC